MPNHLAHETRASLVQDQDSADARHPQGEEASGTWKVAVESIVPPRAPGIYQIRCLPTGKIYVGSAKDLRARWGEHRRRLHRGTHRNAHLQHAWSKYGETSFVFTVLELVEKSALLQAEQAWIDRTRCTDRRIGFNLYAVAGSPGDTLAQVWEGFMDPDGNEVTITNLHEFCRHRDLDFPSMHRLAMGKSKLKSYKGWTHRNSPRKREYIKTYDGFIDPDGMAVETITNLAAFCRAHGLDNTHMVAVAHGRIHSYRGWTHLNSRRDLGLSKTHEGFISPDGQRVSVTNLAAFCRDHGLQVVHMHGLKSGKRRQHKGWTWSNPHE
jgi:group I intron endonuclease